MSADPHLVGPTGSRHLGQAIGRNGFIVIALGGSHPIPALLPTAKVLLAHEPANAIAAVSTAAVAQGHLNAG
jgi:hypothetical protein